MTKFKYHYITVPGKSLAFFCTGSAKVVGVEGISEASKSGRYSFTVRQPIPHHHWVPMLVGIVLMITVRLVTVSRQLPNIFLITVVICPQI